MAEITINNVKFTNVPNKKAGTKFASALTQSNIGVSQSVEDYMNSAYFYTLVNAVDINWNGIEIGENSYINSTADLISYINTKGSNVDLSSYATISYVNDKISEVIGGAPETLDTLKELADALEDEANLSYVTEALAGKANVNDVYTKQEVNNLIPDLSSYSTTSYVTAELDKKADTDYHVEMFIYRGNNYTFNNRPFKGYDSCYLYDIFYFIIFDHKHNILFDSREWTGTNKNELITYLKDNYNLEFYSNDGGVSQYYLNIETIYNKKYLRLNFSNALNYSNIIYDGKFKFDICRTINNSRYIYATLTYDDFGFRMFVDSIIISNKSNNLAYYYTKTEVDNLIPDLSSYATTSYVTTELDNKADKTQLPDMTQYVSISSYNALAARVEELAGWITSYHSSYTPTPSGTDPDIYFDDSELTLNNLIDSSKLNGGRKTQSLKGGNKDDSNYITWSTSDSAIATVQGNGYVIAHGNGTVNVIVNYAAHDNYNSKTIQYQLTITNYKLYSTGQWYNNGDPVDSIEVVQGGSSTYTLTFSGTPSDSWTFSIDSAVNGISLDTTTGTITINESQLNTTGVFGIIANRQTDTNYYEGSASVGVIITSSTTTKTLTVSDRNFQNATAETRTPETFTMGQLDYGDRIGAADLVLSYTTTSNASISIDNVNITHHDWATETTADVSFDLVVGTGVVQGDNVNIYAELTDNGAGYSMTNSYVGNIELNPVSAN